MKTKIAALNKTKHIALVAHDNMKPALQAWVKKNQQALAKHNLYATGTTGHTLEAIFPNKVEKFISGPLGGDQQIGAKISEGDIDLLIFFWDPLAQLPHDPDIKALLRLATLWNIPVACNPASADYLISSELVNTAYEREIPDYASYIQGRTS